MNGYHHMMLALPAVYRCKYNICMHPVTIYPIFLKDFPDCLAYSFQLAICDIGGAGNAEAVPVYKIGAVVLMEVDIIPEHSELVHGNPEWAALHLIVVQYF